MSDIEEQVWTLAGAYVRHGGKGNRKRQVKRLVTACVAAAERWRIADVRQIGKRHVRWFDEQLRHEERSLRTRENYWRLGSALDLAGAAWHPTGATHSLVATFFTLASVFFPPPWSMKETDKLLFT